MSPKRLGILLLLAVLVGAVALLLRRPHEAPRDARLGTLLLPALGPKLDAVSGLRLIGAGNQTLVALARRDGTWRVREPDYAADAVKVRRLLIALSDLKVAETKTAEPGRYASLGVEDPAAAGAGSVRVELDGLGEPLSLIVGRSSGTQGSFVRLPSAPQAVLARPALDLAKTPRDWLVRSFLDLAASRIASVEVARAGEPAWEALRAERNAAHFSVARLPKGKELSSAGAADPAGSAFGSLEFDEVRAAAMPAAGAKRHKVTVRCYDGLMVTLAGDAAGEAHWVGVEAHYDAALAARYAASAPKDAPAADKVQKEAADIGAVVAGHEYKIPNYRFDGIFRPLKELLRK
jgi:hypothetical protein